MSIATHDSLALSLSSSLMAGARDDRQAAGSRAGDPTPAAITLVLDQMAARPRLAAELRHAGEVARARLADPPEWLAEPDELRRLTLAAARLIALADWLDADRPGPPAVPSEAEALAAAAPSLVAAKVRRGGLDGLAGAAKARLGELQRRGMEARSRLTYQIGPAGLPAAEALDEALALATEALALEAEAAALRTAVDGIAPALGAEVRAVIEAAGGSDAVGAGLAEVRLLGSPDPIDPSTREELVDVERQLKLLDVPFDAPSAVGRLGNQLLQRRRGLVAAAEDARGRQLARAHSTALATVEGASRGDLGAFAELRQAAADFPRAFPAEVNFAAALSSAPLRAAAGRLDRSALAALAMI